VRLMRRPISPETAFDVDDDDVPCLSVTDGRRTGCARWCPSHADALTKGRVAPPEQPFRNSAFGTPRYARRQMGALVGVIHSFPHLRRGSYSLARPDGDGGRRPTARSIPKWRLRSLRRIPHVHQLLSVDAAAANI